MTEFLTAKDIAKRYQISLAAVYAFVRDGKIPCGLRLGRSRRWPLHQIEEFEKRELGILEEKDTHEGSTNGNKTL